MMESYPGSLILPSYPMSKTIINKEKQCVACLSLNVENLAPVSENIVSELSFLANVEVEKNDMICNTCNKILSVACHFKRQCIFSQFRMRSITNVDISKCETLSSMKMNDSCLEINSMKSEKSKLSYNLKNKIKHSVSIVESNESSSKIKTKDPVRKISSNNLEKSNKPRPGTKSEQKFISKTSVKNKNTIKKTLSNTSIPRSLSKDSKDSQKKKTSTNKKKVPKPSKNMSESYVAQVCDQVLSKMNTLKRYKTKHFSKLTNLFVAELNKSGKKKMLKKMKTKTICSGVCSGCGLYFLRLSKHIMICPSIRKRSRHNKICNSDKHISNENKSRQNFYCTDCGKMFMSKMSLIKHKKTNHDTRESINSPKSKSSNNSVKSKQSKKSDLGVKKIFHVCEICFKDFPDENKLLKHFASHNEKLYFDCFICLGQFKQKEDLAHHMKIQHGDIFKMQKKIVNSSPSIKSILKTSIV